MERVYAFIDESGAFGGDTKNPSVSKLFVITAILLKKEELQNSRIISESVRKNNFQSSEMKSNKIGTNSKRRLNILQELDKIPFQFISLVINKEQLDAYRFPGLKYKRSFYKFLNNIIYSELKKTFPFLNITADSTGSTGFSESFLNYMKEETIHGDLFTEQDIELFDSKDEVLIQLADIISGTISYIFDDRKEDQNKEKYKNLLEKHRIKIEFYPKNYKTFVVSESSLATEYMLSPLSRHFSKKITN